MRILKMIKIFYHCALILKNLTHWPKSCIGSIGGHYASSFCNHFIPTWMQLSGGGENFKNTKKPFFKQIKKQTDGRTDEQKWTKGSKTDTDKDKKVQKWQKCPFICDIYAENFGKKFQVETKRAELNVKVFSFIYFLTKWTPQKCVRLQRETRVKKVAEEYMVNSSAA